MTVSSKNRDRAIDPKLLIAQGQLRDDRCFDADRCGDNEEDDTDGSSFRVFPTLWQNLPWLFLLLHLGAGRLGETATRSRKEPAELGDSSLEGVLAQRLDGNLRNAVQQDTILFVLSIGVVVFAMQAQFRKRQLHGCLLA